MLISTAGPGIPDGTLATSEATRSSTDLEDSDVPSVALHGLLKFTPLQALLGANPVQVLVEVQTWFRQTCKSVHLTPQHHSVRTTAVYVLHR